ncbi:MAG: hypothetical protein ACR2QE_12260 [Acidimicrobiales bacterium]
MAMVLIGVFFGAIAVSRGTASGSSGIVGVAVVALVVLVIAILRATIWWRRSHQPRPGNEFVNTSLAYGSLSALFVTAIASLFVG